MQMGLVQNLIMMSLFMNQKRKNLMHSILGVRDRCFIYIFLFYFILFQFLICFVSTLRNVPFVFCNKDKWAELYV